MEFYGKLKAGKLTIINLPDVEKKLMGEPDCPLVKINLEPQVGRSLSLNGYLHYVLIPGFWKALRSKGNEVRTASQAKKIMKEMFLVQSVYNESKQDYEDVIRDTSSLTQKETHELIEDVIRWTVINTGHEIKFPGEK